MGAQVTVEGLTTSAWSGVSFTIRAGEIAVLLGPSGSGKSALLRSLVGLVRPEKGSIRIDGREFTRLSQRQLFAARRHLGVLFEDGGLFGALSLFDNIALPLREHTRKSEREIAALAGETMELVGLGAGSGGKFPAQVSAGMRKRAGLARALVLDPDLVLIDEPSAGLDPVRTANLSQLIVDLSQHTGSTFLLVTHDVATARTVPDSIGLLFGGRLVQFGPRELMLTSQDPVVRQFLTGQRSGPIGIDEEADEPAGATTRPGPLPPIPLQLTPSDGRPRASQRPPGEWLLAHGVEPPRGSFAADPLAADPLAQARPVLAVATAPEPPEPSSEPAEPSRGLDEPTVELPKVAYNPRVVARTRAAQRAQQRPQPRPPSPNPYPYPNPPLPYPPPAQAQQRSLGRLALHRIRQTRRPGPVPAVAASGKAAQEADR